MPLETLFISGPPGGGKSTMARLVVDEVVGRPVHYLRMRCSRDGHTNAVVADPCVPAQDRDRWSSSHTVQYSSDRVFETIPEGLRTVRRLEHKALVLIEADADPPLRHAFPYDYRLFVMPPPQRVESVFRDAASAAAALQQVMQDTASFASEIFGMFDPSGLEDNVGVQHVEPQAARSGIFIEQLAVDEQQIRHFLNSPLGAEIASRIQLQPDYYGLVESDVAAINTGTRPVEAKGETAAPLEPGRSRAGEDDAVNACVRRLEKLLKRIRQDARRQSVLYWGDLRNPHDPCRNKLIQRIKALFSM